MRTLLFITLCFFVFQIKAEPATLYFDASITPNRATKDAAVINGNTHNNSHGTFQVTVH